MSKRVCQLVEQFSVAEQKARFQDGGADGHVRLGLADAFVDRAGGVADLEPGVPQAIENRLGDRLAPGGLLVRQQEQQIDVGAGRLQPAAVAAGRDHRHALGFGRILRRIKMLAREVEQQADDLVFHPAQPLGAAPAVAILEQQLLGLGAAVGECCFQALRHRRTQLALAAGVRPWRASPGRRRARARRSGRPRPGGRRTAGAYRCRERAKPWAIGIAEAGP